MPSPERARIVIVGCGFGGLFAAKALSRTPAEVLIIDRNNYHLFQPLLYQVASAALAPADIAQPIRTILRHQKNASVMLAEVTAVDLSRRTVFAGGPRNPLRLPDPRPRRGRQLLRPRGLAGAGAGHEGGGGGDSDPLAPAALVRARGDRGGLRGARRAAHLRHRRRRTDRRGTRRRHQGARGGRDPAGFPRGRHAPRARAPHRGRPAPAAGVPPGFLGTGARAAARAARGSAARGAGDAGAARRRRGRRRLHPQLQRHLGRRRQGGAARGHGSGSRPVPGDGWRWRRTARCPDTRRCSSSAMPRT